MRFSPLVFFAGRPPSRLMNAPDTELERDRPCRILRLSISPRDSGGGGGFESELEQFRHMAHCRRGPRSSGDGRWGSWPIRVCKVHRRAHRRAGCSSKDARGKMNTLESGKFRPDTWLYARGYMAMWMWIHGPMHLDTWLRACGYMALCTQMHGYMLMDTQPHA
jgi:hypothetical protein